MRLFGWWKMTGKSENFVRAKEMTLVMMMSADNFGEEEGEIQYIANVNY